MDGNFHANRSKKNTDPNDTSLYGGTSYFPSDAFLKEQLAKAPQTEEVNVIFAALILSFLTSD